MQTGLHGIELLTRYARHAAYARPENPAKSNLAGYGVAAAADHNLDERLLENLNLCIQENSAFYGVGF